MSKEPSLTYDPNTVINPIFPEQQVILAPTAHIRLDTKDPTKLKLRLPVQQMMPDRTQYKPYSVMYGGGLYVEVTVTLAEVVEFDSVYVVLTPEGIAHVADQLATALDTMHDEFRNKPRTF